MMPLFGALYVADPSARAAAEAVARDFSPRVAVADAQVVTCDLAGAARLFGDAMTIAREMRRTAADQGLMVRVAIAGTCTAARVLAHARPGLTVVEPGDEAGAVGELSIEWLIRVIGEDVPEDTPSPRRRSVDPRLLTFRRWGVRTLGEFARVPAAEVSARLGQDGVRWQRVARGEDLTPLVPAVPEERFEQGLALEWPIEGLEPLSFVLARLMEPLAAHLEARDRGAAVLHVRLSLVTREVYERTLQLPMPMRDAKTLRTLALLDVESHPPSAAIDRVVVAVDPTPARTVQYSLLARPLPAPEQMATLLARLDALMGEGRCGAPALVDSWEPGAHAVAPFMPREEVRADVGACPAPPVALRRFRRPLPARVTLHDEGPARVSIDREGMQGGRVQQWAGPWRTSGGWWVDAATAGARERGPHAWDRDEWDVALADGGVYRVFRERDTNRWFIEGVVD